MVDPKIAACKGKLYRMIALIFVSGMLGGAFTMGVADRYWLQPQSAMLNEAEKAMAVQHFSQELELNPEQAKAIEDILDEFIMQQANLMAEFKNSRTSGHNRLLKILNEDQRKRLEKVLSEMGARRRD